MSCGRAFAASALVALLGASAAAQSNQPSPNHQASTAADPRDPPRVERIDVTGAERTRRTVIVDALGLEPQQVLTPGSLARARRRLRALPAVDDADVQYTARQGDATVEAVVSEGAVYPHGVIPLAALTARPIFARDLQVDFAGPSGRGERWTVAFRWPEERRRLKAAFAVPAPGVLPGILTIEGRWERQTYDVFDGEGGAAFREGRRRGSARLADWATGWLHWDAGAGIDHLRDATYASADAAIEARLAGDRVALGWRQGYWRPAAGAGGAVEGFARASLHAAWRSSTREGAAGFTAWAERTIAGSGAPLALWPGADSGQAREAFIRAHPLLDDYITRSDAVLGRRLTAATLEYERPVRDVAGAGIGVAGFLDVARATARAFGPDRVWQADVGAGARLHAPGLGGTARLDFAVGLRDGHMLLSAGYMPDWANW